MNSKSFYPLVIAAVITLLFFPSVMGFSVSPTNLNPSVDPGEYVMIGGYFTPSFSGTNDYTVVLIEGTSKLDGLTDPDIINRMPSRRMGPGETLTFSFNERMSTTPGDYTYEVVVWCTQWGTEGSSAVVTVHVNGQVDTTKPSVYIASHKTDDVVPTSSIILSGTASDASGISKIVTLRTGTTSTWTGSISGNDWIATVPLIEGKNSITVEAHDQVGNIGSAYINIYYTVPTAPDTTAPTITVQSPINDDTVGTPDIILKGITTDDIATTEVTATIGTVTKTATGTDSWQVPITLAEGPNTITVTAKDAAGNSKSVTHTLTYSTELDPTDNGSVVIPPAPDLITDLLLDQTININDGEQITLSGTIAHTSPTSIYYDILVHDQDTGEVYAKATSVLAPANDITTFTLPVFTISPGAHTLILKADTDLTALATTRLIEISADGKISDPQIPDVTDPTTQAAAQASDENTVVYPVLTFIIVWFISRKIIEYKEAS